MGSSKMAFSNSVRSIRTLVAVAALVLMGAALPTLGLSLTKESATSSLLADFAHHRVVSPNYFKVMRIPLLKGRLFTEADISASPAVVIVSRSTADRLWPCDDPIGKMMRANGFAQELRVIGVVADANCQDPSPEVYLPLFASPSSPVIFVAMPYLAPGILIAKAGD